MKIRIRCLIAVAMLWLVTLAQAVTVTERLQWHDALQTGVMAPQGDPAWRVAEKKIQGDVATGTLWLRLRVQVSAQEDLYLMLRDVNVHDLAVGVQYLAAADAAALTPPMSMVPLDAANVRDPMRLLRGLDTGTSEAFVWIRTQSGGWFEADVLSPTAWMQQREMDAAINAMQLASATLLIGVSLLLWRQSRKRIFAWMASLGFLCGLYPLQVSGTFIEPLQQNLTRYASLRLSLFLLLGCTFFYVAAMVMASPRPTLRIRRSFYGLMAASVLVALLAEHMSYVTLNVVAAVLLSLAPGTFFAASLRPWSHRRVWRKNLLNQVLGVVWFVVALVSLSVFNPWVSPALQLPDWRGLHAIDLPMLSWGLMYLLQRRRQRAHSGIQRRQQANWRQLREQTNINSLQQQFIAMLVHEIKTPLTVLQLGAQALLKSDLSPERKQAWSQRMHTAIGSTVQILDNCSQVERYEGGVMAVSPIHFSVAESLQALQQQVVDQHQDKSERLQLRIDRLASQHQVHTDPSYFHIIVNNLVSNALKYSMPDTAVVMQLSSVTDAQSLPSIQFAVRNIIGPFGSPDPAQVFSRYYRCEDAVSVSGTGLGLWLSQKLAERLGTRIHLSLEAGQVVFWFTLPAHSKVPDPSTQTPAPAAH